MRSEYGFIFWIHLLVIFMSFTAWALFDWKLVAVGMALYFLQALILGECIITRLQFGPSDSCNSRTTFFYHYLRKLGLPITNRQVSIFADLIVPPLVFCIALISQVRYGWEPLWL